MSQKVMKECLIFVYGTLREKGALPITDLLGKSVTYIGKASIEASMYLVDFYPGIIIESVSKNRVKGEVYRLHNLQDDLPVLDEYEGVSSPPQKNDLFKKISIEATLYNGEKIRCMAYAYNRKISPSMRFIESGDYVEENGLDN